MAQAARINPQELLLGAAPEQVAQFRLPVVDAGPATTRSRATDVGASRLSRVSFSPAGADASRVPSEENIDVQVWGFISGLEIDELRPNRFAASFGGSSHGRLRVFLVVHDGTVRTASYLWASACPLGCIVLATSSMSVG
ncbi:MAG: hypothetical protein IPN63_00210 [Gammaproteobacteria bacterium]|nr:hypothetical protein [Gammaproteobacteria bacterium]